MEAPGRDPDFPSDLSWALFVWLIPLCCSCNSELELPSYTDSPWDDDVSAWPRKWPRESRLQAGRPPTGICIAQTVAPPDPPTGPIQRITAQDEYGIECPAPTPTDYFMPKSLVILALLFLFLAGVMLLSLSVFDRNYQDLGVGGCVLLGSAVIAAAIVGPTTPR